MLTESLSLRRTWNYVISVRYSSRNVQCVSTKCFKCLISNDIRMSLLDKSKFSRDTINFQKGISHFMAHSLAVFCTIASFLHGSYITAREWQSSPIPYNRNKIVYGVCLQNIFHVCRKISRNQPKLFTWFLTHHVLWVTSLSRYSNWRAIASVCENTISELSLSQISALSMHFYSWF